LASTLLIAVDEGGVRRTAAQRLDAERAGAGEEVEDPGALDAIAQDREERLPHAVGGRAGGLRREDAPALVGAGDDPQQTHPFGVSG
jgi:hypothetical protein